MRENSIDTLNIGFDEALLLDANRSKYQANAQNDTLFSWGSGVCLQKYVHKSFDSELMSFKSVYPLMNMLRAVIGYSIPRSCGVRACISLCEPLFS